MSIISRCLAGAALVALVATGCSTTPGPAPAAIPATATPSASASSSAPPSRATPTQTSAAGAAQRCRLADLTPATTRPDGATNQQQIRVVWTNTSGRACTMTGFGGADLVASPRSEDRYSLPRSDRPAATVRLAPGEQAHSTIVFLPASTGSGRTYAPTKVLVTPPDETNSVLLDWSGGPVLDQRSATRPGTYLQPVERGAS